MGLLGELGQRKLNTKTPEQIAKDVRVLGVCETAKFLGVHRMTINRIECGEQIRKKTAAKLEQALLK